MDRAAALKNASAYATEVCKVLNPCTIIMYGSYANGTPDPESDIDIAVIFNGYKGNWLKDSAVLWELTRRVSTHIEPILLDRTQDPSGFVANVFNSGEVIYSAE